MKNERILVADDSRMIRENISEVLEMTPGFEVVGQAANLRQVREFLDTHPSFTLAVLDHNMPSAGEGKQAAQLIRASQPHVRIVSLAGDLQTYGDLNFAKITSIFTIIKAIQDLP